MATPEPNSSEISSSSDGSSSSNGPNPIDVYVGERVRARRKLMDMSQTELALALGLTFQQVQKYERGTNRISASKLYDISRALKVPIEYLFSGYDSSDLPPGDAAEGQQAVHLFLTLPDGIELARAFPRIRDKRRRQKVLDLVYAMSEA